MIAKQCGKRKNTKSTINYLLPEKQSLHYSVAGAAEKGTAKNIITKNEAFKLFFITVTYLFTLLQIKSHMVFSLIGVLCCAAIFSLGLPSIIAAEGEIVSVSNN